MAFALMALIAIYLAEGAIRRSAPPCLATKEEGVTIRAVDGTQLVGRLVRREAAGDRCVLLLHGVGDDGSSQLPFAKNLAAKGITGIAIDIRGHGVSGGELRGYGVLEAGDTALWANYLRTLDCDGGVFGYGASMGAAILIQSVGAGAPFKAIVAECPFSSFRLIAEQRIQQRSGVPLWLSRAVSEALVSLAFTYVELKYGIDLALSAPENTNTRGVPILLIHGGQDNNVPPEHSIRLKDKLADATLWLVPGAAHINANQVAPFEFDERVNAWFSTVTRSKGH
jgi:hypothetical protein